jgi:hypothetical protein
VKALFVELPALERHRSEYLDDEAFSALQAALMVDPEAGDVIRDTGGLRKVRFDRQPTREGQAGRLARHLLLVSSGPPGLGLHPVRKR